MALLRDMRANLGSSGGLAGASGLVWLVLYGAHRALQGTGPANTDPQALSVYFTEHRSAMLLSEAANGLGLIAFALFVGGLVASLRQCQEQVITDAVLVSGTLFVAMGLVSTATETALVHVAESADLSATRVLFELQARVPVVLAITALTFVTSWALLRTSLLPRWVGITGLGVSALFVVGSVSSLVGPPEGGASLVGVGLFLLWMVVLCVGLLRGPVRRA